MRTLALLLITSLTLINCQKSLEKQVREQVRTIDNAALDPESVEILEIRQSGNQAIAEVNIRTAVRMRKEGNDWILQDVRLGDRRWESVDRILEALEQSRNEQTLRDLDQLQAGIEGYRRKEGRVPPVDSFVKLVDALNPDFLPVVIRIDAWWNPYRYQVNGDSKFELRSAGPDGRFETVDDLVRN